MSESIFLDMATHWLLYTGHKKKDSIFLLQRLTLNVTLWLLPRSDHLLAVNEAIHMRFCPCSLLANWLRCTFDPLLGGQLIAVGAFPGCSIAVPIWSALCGHTTVALETNLCYVFGHSKCDNWHHKSTSMCWRQRYSMCLSYTPFECVWYCLMFGWLPQKSTQKYFWLYLWSMLLGQVVWSLNKP